MKLNCKCMLLGRDWGLKKDGSPWYKLRFLDKESGEQIDCFVDSYGKYEKSNLYDDVECKFILKNQYDKNLKTKIWKFDVEV